MTIVDKYLATEMFVFNALRCYICQGQSIQDHKLKAGQSLGQEIWS